MNELIERIDGFIPYRRIKEYPHCTCNIYIYFHYSLIYLLIHLNDHHQMTSQELGNWLETKGM
jgi:hypothetical protein